MQFPNENDIIIPSCTTPEAVAEENPSTEAATEEAAAENASVAHRTRASARKNVEQDN